MQLICLPATAPEDIRFGLPPARLKAFPDLTIHVPRFPRQIPEHCHGQRILAGFSKSALGAWNLTREAPDLFSATILFDAPVARLELPPWDTADFYADDSAWQADQPLLNLNLFLQSVPGTHPLVLISGELFHDEMAALSAIRKAAGCCRRRGCGSAMARRCCWMRRSGAAIFRPSG